MLCLEARRQHVENELLALAPRRIRRGQRHSAEMAVHCSREQVIECLLSTNFLSLVFQTWISIGNILQELQKVQTIHFLFQWFSHRAASEFSHRFLRTRWAIPFVPGVKSAKNSSTKIVLVSGVRGIQHTKQSKNWRGITRRDVSCVFFGWGGIV